MIYNHIKRHHYVYDKIMTTFIKNVIYSALQVYNINSMEQFMVMAKHNRLRRINRNSKCFKILREALLVTQLMKDHYPKGIPQDNELCVVDDILCIKKDGVYEPLYSRYRNMVQDHIQVVRLPNVGDDVYIIDTARFLTIKTYIIGTYGTVFYTLSDGNVYTKEQFYALTTKLAPDASRENL